MTSLDERRQPILAAEAARVRRDRRERLAVTVLVGLVQTPFDIALPILGQIDDRVRLAMRYSDRLILAIDGSTPPADPPPP